MVESVKCSMISHPWQGFKDNIFYHDYTGRRYDDGQSDDR